MADEKVQSTEQPAPAPGDELGDKLRQVEDVGDKLRQMEDVGDKLRQVEDVSEAIHKAIDSNQLSDDDRKDLEELSNVLDKIKGRLTPQDHRDDSAKKDEEELLPQSKRDELVRLLEEIKRALQQRKQRQPEPSEHAVQRKKMLSMATGCNPFNKLRSPSSQEKKSSEQGGGGGTPQEEDEAVSLKLLVRLAQHVLEPEQYYEWTTSYVDESRIYGWDEEAGQVVGALIGPEEGDFRAAAITGIHGSGKTALAQKVFVHDRVKDNFPIRLWVCVGPPDSEDRFNLLYRMLDNLGLDTNRVEDVIVDGADVVKKKREEEKGKITKEEEEVMRKRASEMANKEAQKPDDATENKEDAKAKADRIYEQLVKEKVESTLAVQTSKIGVLLYILHVTLSKTGYLIVFDDIRVYGDDGWYNNLTLPPPAKGEWGDRLAYGLPKTATKHRNAVLVTCRKEDDARAMVRTGRVFRPPKLQVDNGWKLFEREYKQAKTKKENKDQQEDLLFKELEQMKEEIVNKCLGLPVAIIEAAIGFALSGLEPLPDPPLEKAAAAGSTSNKDTQADDDKAAVQ